MSISTIFPSIPPPSVDNPNALMETLTALKANVELLNGTTQARNVDGVPVIFPRMFITNKNPAGARPNDLWYNTDTKVLSVALPSAGSAVAGLTLKWSPAQTGTVTVQVTPG